MAGLSNSVLQRIISRYYQALTAVLPADIPRPPFTNAAPELLADCFAEELERRRIRNDELHNEIIQIKDAHRKSFEAQQTVFTTNWELRMIEFSSLFYEKRRWYETTQKFMLRVAPGLVADLLQHNERDSNESS